MGSCLHCKNSNLGVTYTCIIGTHVGCVFSILRHTPGLRVKVELDCWYKALYITSCYTLMRQAGDFRFIRVKENTTFFSQPIFSRHRPHWHRTSTFFMTSITVLQCQWFRKCKRPWQKHLVAQFSLHADNLSTIPLPPLECVIGVMYTSECTRREWISQTTFSNNFPITEGDFYSALETTVMNSTSNRIKLYLWMPLRTISKGFGAVKHWW